MRSHLEHRLVIFLTAAAVLLYEIAITRLLSVVLWYHFAFLAISLAMLGLAAPGVWFTLRPPRNPVGTPLFVSLLAAGITIPASVLAILHPPWPRDGALAHLHVVMVVLCLLPPLLAMGSGVCLLLMAARGRGIGSMYGADLLGATYAACLVVPLLDTVPTPQLLAATALLPLAGAILISVGRRRVAVVVAVAGLAGLLWTEAPWQLRYSKTDTAEQVVYERWTPTARLAVLSEVDWQDDPDIGFLWGLGSAYPGYRVEQMWVEQDGSAGTPLTRLDGAPADLPHLFYDVTSVGYQLRAPDAVCVIGAGGGRDILTALAAGARHVDAVELNQGIVDLASDVFAEYTGDVYRLPGVRAVVSEGRSFLTRAERRYDLIQISLIDSWAATSAGAYALSENYLYTREALALYLRRLEARGILSISRWMRGDFQLEGARLALLARAALEEAGFADPLRHLLVVEGGNIVTVLVSPTPWDATALDRLDAVCAERGFIRHWPPQDASQTPSLPARMLIEGPAALEAQGLFLDPPTDERPFFFQNIRAFSPYDRELAGVFSVNEEAALLPRYLILMVGALTALLLFAPFVGRSGERWGGRGSGGDPSRRLGGAYFLAIGLGFMWVEIPLIQKFILFLGHPSYAITVVLSALLLGSGVGSFVAGRLAAGHVERWRWLPALVAAVVNLWVPLVIAAGLGQGFAVRVMVSLLVITPLGFVLGFPFPSGMIRFGDASRGGVGDREGDRAKAWFWAVNGAGGVLASVSALAFAAYVGLSNVVWLGVVAYLLAGFALRSGGDYVQVGADPGVEAIAGRFKACQ